MTENLYDLTFRLGIIRTVRRQFHDHLVTVYRTFGALLRHKDILQKSLIIRNHKSVMLALCHLIETYNLCRTALRDLHDLTFLTLSFRRSS